MQIENDHRTHSKFSELLVRFKIRISCGEIRYLLSLVSLFTDKASERIWNSLKNE